MLYIYRNPLLKITYCCSFWISVSPQMVIQSCLNFTSSVNKMWHETCGKISTTYACLYVLGVEFTAYDMDTVLHSSIFQAVLHKHGRQMQMLQVLTCGLQCAIWMFSSTFTFVHWNVSRHHHTENWTTFMQFLININICGYHQIFNRNIHIVIAENNIMHICIFFIWKSKWHVHSCI